MGSNNTQTKQKQTTGKENNTYKLPNPSHRRGFNLKHNIHEINATQATKPPHTYVPQTVQTQNPICHSPIPTWTLLLPKKKSDKTPNDSLNFTLQRTSILADKTGGPILGWRIILETRQQDVIWELLELWNKDRGKGESK